MNDKRYRLLMMNRRSQRGRHYLQPKLSPKGGKEMKYEGWKTALLCMISLLLLPEVASANPDAVEQGINSAKNDLAPVGYALSAAAFLIGAALMALPSDFQAGGKKMMGGAIMAVIGIGIADETVSWVSGLFA